ncbi:transcriptional regulator BetI [Shewanella algae]|uniref:transcriptional regulator BetI n=1 Tax=Shewanella TaxID=22 RepID=UPI00048BE7D5|nr:MULTISPECIES: transcriptional regulator BetI [Shewanella]EKT4485717.1 transcriptional regulator BetI [Shewanella algae]MBO2547312.1 transcriptional regulator BetI [Shewanella algae]MBO2560541.1 transcriptional regulator BetI [Shewanella algae]MBO2611541.1 transcriptional regulator BetI [Shewanella algae]MCE9773915.1 transcriptional regulator BetI [Shewanella algae]
MPKIGMKPVRRQQLIDATMASVAANGLHNTTINSISHLAGLSSGIISHYFGGKQELIEATLRHLLEQLKLALLAQTAERQLSPKARLHAIVAANFTEFQRSGAATRTWLNFWAQSMHEPGLARLQQVNSARLQSNLAFSFKQLLPREQALKSAEQVAAMIDGFWLRSALSPEPEQAFAAAESWCIDFIDQSLAYHGVH